MAIQTRHNQLQILIWALIYLSHIRPIWFLASLYERSCSERMLGQLTLLTITARLGDAGLKVRKIQYLGYDDL